MRTEIGDTLDLNGSPNVRNKLSIEVRHLSCQLNEHMESLEENEARTKQG